MLSPSLAALHSHRGWQAVFRVVRQLELNRWLHQLELNRESASAGVEQVSSLPQPRYFTLL